MKRLPERLFVKWSDDGIVLEATDDYKVHVQDVDGDGKVVVGVYRLENLQVVEKSVTLSTRKVSKRGKIGRHP